MARVVDKNRLVRDREARVAGFENISTDNKNTPTIDLTQEAVQYLRLMPNRSLLVTTDYLDWALTTGA